MTRKDLSIMLGSMIGGAISSGMSVEDAKSVIDHAANDEALWKTIRNNAQHLMNEAQDLKDKYDVEKARS